MLRTAACLTLLAFAVPAAADEDGFKPLFNGTDLSGWQTAGGEPVTKGWTVQDGAIVRESGGGNIFTKDRYGDYVLTLEFKTTGNSGVLFRVDNPKDYIQTGIEVQVDNPAEKPDRHTVGAIYDLVAPKHSMTKKDDWNTMTITAKGNMIAVELNGEQVAEMDLDKWTEGNKNPDGSKNKFKTALKDFRREGYIGLQDHGNKVMYRNVRIKVLK